MIAETLFRAEQLHLFRLLVWGGGSILAGTSVLVVITWRRSGTALLRQFARQLIVWGAVELACVFVAWHGLTIPDVAAATRLDRHLWFNLGLDTAGIGAGLVVIGIGGSRARRLGLIGAGLGVVLQCTALLLLNAQLAAVISR
jgi:Family of unknown function (DUF6992)